MIEVSGRVKSCDKNHIYIQLGENGNDQNIDLIKKKL